ncbi:MAG: glycosyltransferase [Acidimicrobiales bacterium]
MPPSHRLRAVGVVVPVHNEESLVMSALGAIERAIRSLPSDVESRVAVVLDSCDDASPRLVRHWSEAPGRSAVVVDCRGRNVGLARRKGCAAILSDYAAVDPSELWLATTDADSLVPADWLGVQVAARDAGFDMWAGRIGVGDWTERPLATRIGWKRFYAGEHEPIHGASLGFTATAYVELEGFRALRSGEDRDLCQRGKSVGLRVRHDTRAVVRTSARRAARAPRGFAHALDKVDQGGRPVSPQPLACVG